MKTFTQKMIVEEKHAASELGSGSLYVFGTPALTAFMENTASKTINGLEPGMTTVGIEINIKHLKASKIGEKITCTATLTKKEGRLYEFEITATNSAGNIIGTAAHKRIAVEIERFMKNLQK